MSRKIFFLFFLLLFLCGHLCRQGRAAQSGPLPSISEENTIFELERDQIDVFEPDGTKKQRTQITVKNFESVFLVANNGFMVALADVNDGKPDKTKISVLTKYFEIKKENVNWGKEAIQSSKNDKWNAQLAVKELEKTKTEVVIKSFAVAAEKDKIFLIMVSSDTCEKCNPSQPPSTKAEWHVTLVEGKVNVDSDSKKAMVWTNLNFHVSYENSKLEELLKTQQLNILPVEGFVFVADNKKYIIFVIKNNAGNNNNITAVFQLEEGGEKSLLPVDGTAGCYPTFFQWKGKIFKTPTDEPKDCGEKMMVFNTKGKNFTECTDPIARLRDFLKNKKYFTTAKINENDNVLLFTREETKIGGEKDVHLWMTDGTRVSNAGTIIEKIKSTFYGSVLHTEKELFALHQAYQQGQKEDNKFSLKRLPDQLKNITGTLDAWKNNIDKINQLCGKTDKQNIICTKTPPTDDLIGFLHNTLNEENSNIIWKDEYYYSNVIVEKTKAKNATNGLTFSGKESGAKWVMRKQNDNFLYNFINFGFTLVATVTITNNRSNNKNSILGVSLTPNNNVGLWCTTDGKWGVSSGNNLELKISDNEECKQGYTYNVALVLETQKLDIYVNGEKLTTEIKKIETSQSITHFYFGVENKQDIESHMTVSNVLLYNRPFTGEEIAKLKEYMQSKKIVPPPDKNKATTAHEDERIPTPLPQGTNENEEKIKEKVPSPSRTEDGGVGGGVRVFSLLLAVLCAALPLLCVSVPLLHL